jgi:hypothetical protein
MADLGKSQVRQVQNLGNSPTGQTGYPSGARGDAYHKFGSNLDAQGRVAKNVTLKSAVSPAGSGTDGPSYFELAATQDSQTRFSKPSGGMFGGQSGSAGLTQADTGSLPTPTGGGGPSVTTYFLMRARDPDCVTQPTYVYWKVTGTPDSTGSQYAGSRCGVHPLVEIVVQQTWKQ